MEIKGAHPEGMHVEVTAGSVEGIRTTKGRGDREDQQEVKGEEKQG